MTQTLCPLFGEFYTDASISRAVAHPAGIVAKPTVAFGGTSAARTVTLGPSTTRGFWVWRSAWKAETGSTAIMETEGVEIALGADPGSGAKHILVVGRWKWLAGPVDASGVPTGVLTQAMRAVYETAHGTAGATPTDPAVAATDTAGRFPVILGRVVLEAGKEPVWQWLTETMLDITELAAGLDGKMNRVGYERHVGRMDVSEAPVGDEGVVRVRELRDRAVTQNASLVAFVGTLPKAWGSPAQVITLGKKAESGSDVKFVASDSTLVELASTGYYELSGHTQGGTQNVHNGTRWELWLRPTGTTGASDRMIAESQNLVDDGGVAIPVYHVWSAVAGDKVYFKGKVKNDPGRGMVASITYVGRQAATQPIAVVTGNWSAMAANGQQYPKIVDIPLTAQNATGGVTWAVTGGTASFTTISGSTATVTFPSTGTWTLQVQVTDTTGATATKTLTLTLSAYEVIPLVVTTTDQSFMAVEYAFAVEFALASTGGESPITWAVVAGANTTMPSAAITGSTLTGSVAEAGTWTVEVQATDGATTPQVVTKTINVTVEDYVYSGGGGGGGIDPWEQTCFEADEVYVLMADGSGKLMRDVAPGDDIIGVFEKAHFNGLRSVSTGMVTDKIIREADDPRPAVVVNGCKATPGHPICVPRSITRAEALRDGDEVMVLREDQKAVAPEPVLVDTTEPVRVSCNLKTRLGTYFVGPTETGPWVLVHNIEDYNLNLC